VQFKEPVGEDGRGGRHMLQLGEGQGAWRVVQARGGLAKVGDQALVVVGVQGRGVHLEGLDHRQQHPGRNRALIGLDLRQVADRQAQEAAGRVKGPAALLAQPLDLRADEELVRH